MLIFYLLFGHRETLLIFSLQDWWIIKPFAVVVSFKVP